MAKSFPSILLLIAIALACPAIDAGAVTKKKKKPAAEADPTPRPRSKIVIKKMDDDDDDAPASRTSKTKPKATPAPAASAAKPAFRTQSGSNRPLADGEMPLMAKGAIALDAYTGKPLYEKNADEPQFPASTTKIMTALLVIEEGNLDQEVEITDEDSKVGESSLNILPGDRYTRRDMLLA